MRDLHQTICNQRLRGTTWHAALDLYQNAALDGCDTGAWNQDREEAGGAFSGIKLHAGRRGAPSSSYPEQEIEVLGLRESGFRYGATTRDAADDPVAAGPGTQIANPVGRQR